MNGPGQDMNSWMVVGVKSNYTKDTWLYSHGIGVQGHHTSAKKRSSDGKFNTLVASAVAKDLKIK